MKLVVVKNEQQTNIYQTEKSITNMDVCQWIVKKKKNFSTKWALSFQ